MDEIAQVGVACGLGRNGQLADRPKVACQKLGTLRNSEHLVRGSLDGAVLERNLLHHADDAVIRLDQRADQSVFPDGDGRNMRVARGQLDRLGIRLGRQRGILLVRRDAQRARLMRDGHGDILGELAAVGHQLGCCGTLCIQLRADGGVIEVVEHLLRVEQLVLRNVGGRELAVQLGTGRDAQRRD